MTAVRRRSSLINRTAIRCCASLAGSVHEGPGQIESLDPPHRVVVSRAVIVSPATSPHTTIHASDLDSDVAGAPAPEPLGLVECLATTDMLLDRCERNDTAGTHRALLPAWTRAQGAICRDHVTMPADFRAAPAHAHGPFLCLPQRDPVDALAARLVRPLADPRLPG